MWATDRHPQRTCAYGGGGEGPSVSRKGERERSKKKESRQRNAGFFAHSRRNEKEAWEREKNEATCERKKPERPTLVGFTRKKKTRAGGSGRAKGKGGRRGGKSRGGKKLAESLKSRIQGSAPTQSMLNGDATGKRDNIQKKGGKKKKSWRQEGTKWKVRQKDRGQVLQKNAQGWLKKERAKEEKG